MLTGGGSHIYPQVERTISAFTPQPQSITALRLVLIFRSAEGRRLSWPGWLDNRRPPREQVVTGTSTVCAECPCGSSCGDRWSTACYCHNIRCVANNGRCIDVLCLVETWHDADWVSCFRRQRTDGFQGVDRPRPRSRADADSLSSSSPSSSEKNL